MNEPWHGTVGGYTNHGCRCTDCRQARAVYAAEHYIATASPSPGRRSWRPEPQPDMGWLTEAACRDEHPSMFVPSGYQWTPDAALKVCDGCPVKMPCLRYGQATRSEGVWGGRLLFSVRTENARSLREERRAS